MAKKKDPKQLKFKDLLHEAGIEIGLTKVEEKQIISRNGWDIYKDIKSVLEKYRSKLPKKLILSNRTIVVPVSEAGKYDPLKSEFFRSEEIFSYFNDVYPATKITTLVEAHLSGEVRSEVIGETIGGKLYSHALTPRQAENVINQIGEKLLAHTEEKVEAHFILFIKGKSERKAYREQNNSDEDAVLLISATVHTFRVTDDRKKFTCHPALIGVVNSANVTQGGFWLKGPWPYPYLLNQEVYKSTIPLNF